MQPANDLDPRSGFPESWHCIDCGTNTAPGLLTKAEAEKIIKAANGDWPIQYIDQVIDNRSEVYTVRDAVWQAAGMQPFGGCLCIGCIEKRLGHKLRPKDFLRGDPFNHPRMPCTPRLLQRRGHRRSRWDEQ
jgi:hypothetical protein